MSDNVNPYESPQSDLNARSPVAGGAGITENMVRYLKEASPWIRFIGIIGFIGCGFILLAGLVFLILSLVASNAIGDAFGGIPTAAMALLYLALGLLTFIPTRFLYKFGSRLRNYVQSGVESELEGAFKSNRSFWKFCGVMTIVYLAAIPVLTIVFVIIGVSSRFL
jgi:hypothetical protein